ncbi:AraC family transcriptional regulator [Azoarcus sp. DD4]|uniref:helix-turn-helix transcriptional regulator n=1 Tax=Azoarcus sp. DD4 TaxID=2027405 RepID=UPI00143CE7BA|nr:AraC family transcriptional regulator [Azoarcus sp. DD4]
MPQVQQSAHAEPFLPAGYRAGVDAHVRIQRVEAGLQRRRYPLLADTRESERVAILLAGGEAEIGGEDEPIALSGPALAWLPVREHHFLRLEAGAGGWMLGLSEAISRDAVGQGAESIHLRYLLDRVTAIGDIDKPVAIGEVQHAFSAIARELQRDERGSWQFLTAHVALILVHLLRLSGLEDVAQRGHSVQATLLLRFRHLVEQHFREHWRVADYAKAMGVSHDRLHDMCVRTLRRTPLDLVHDRLTHEAGLRLVRSGLSIEQVAADLGFRSTTHFSRFFRLRTGQSPARYRSAALATPAALRATASRSYADWP